MGTFIEKSQEATDILRVVLQASSDFISILDENGTFLYINQVIPGLKEGDVVGTTLYTFMPASSVNVAKSAVQKCFATNEPVTYEVEGNGPNNTIAQYFCRLSPCMYHEKRAVLCIGTDVTNYKKVESELRAKVKELETLAAATTERELKMVELKKELEQLKNASHPATAV